jgi:hypothetical protein
MITILGLQEVDNMTREKIENELKELKEAHAADEGMFFFYVLIGFITLYMLHLPFFLERRESLVCLCLTLHVNFFVLFLLYISCPAFCTSLGICHGYLFILFPLSGSYLLLRLIFCLRCASKNEPLDDLQLHC